MILPGKRNMPAQRKCCPLRCQKKLRRMSLLNWNCCLKAVCHAVKVLRRNAEAHISLSKKKFCFILKKNCYY